MIALPDFFVQTQIYESATSRIYRGVRAQDEREIIVKLLQQDYPSPQELTRYRQEYEITRSLNLDGVVKAYGQQDYQRSLVILLEDFGGESLERWVQQPDFCPKSLPMFLRLAINLTDTLAKIHAANIIHKDINPGNIVINCETGVVKMIDFGIATRFNRLNPTFKSPHVFEGTLAYLSPEQTGRMNRPLDYRTDFYSLGVTFYELMTGQLPFATTDILELVHCHIAKQPTPPHELNATVPKPISDIILKLMAKNAEDRYQRAWDIKADLEHLVEQFKENKQMGSIPLALHDVSDQFHIPQKLYGREAEIAALLATFESVATRGTVDETCRKNEGISNSELKVKMMLVSGYAGVGKSALVQELYRPITAKRGYFISGKFDQFQRDIPYSAIANALQKLVRQLLSEPEKTLQQWRSRLLEALGSNGQLIVDVIPEVELIIGKQLPVIEVGATEAQNRFNRVFQQFIRVFCAKDHPLVIFLDDLQWIDSATLKLIELMLLDEQTQSLFLIGTYRDNEVTSVHPLALSLENLRKQGIVPQKIVLAPLILEPLNQLIAETLHQNVGTVATLTKLVLHKTEGNPFFVGEFLRSLYSDNLLSFKPEQRSWQWNIAQIENQNVTSNVVDLLLRKLRKLPESTQKVLQLAACVGAEFDLATLTIVAKQSPQTVFQDLLVAIQAELIQPISELDENLLVQEYKFLHDLVQQAAYALIDESQKHGVHLQIGRNLLGKTSLEQQAERLFEIVGHLNYGTELVTNQVERDEFAKLNLLAGRKAKAAIAYGTARNYFAKGRAWLAKSSWQTNYHLTLDLYVETTEVAYLCGEFEQVEHWVALVLQKASTVLDTVKAYEVKIQTDIAQNQPIKAINTALQVLQQLGIDFPNTPSQSDIHLELNTIAALSREEVENLIHLAERARVLGQFLEAEKFYEQAIQGARENGYIQKEALAYELAAKHYLARGLERFAQLYIKEAHYCYERWGARAKVKDLETRYPQLFSQSSNVVSTPVRTTAGTTSNTSNSALDLATVMKAAQTISSEIELERLLSSLMQILIENAGAQTGCLLLENSGEWAIEAACELNEGEKVFATQVLQSMPMENRVPESIVQYVIRTHESVILNDTTRECHFIDDPYLQNNQIQSLLCLPLLTQNKLVGVLYLENQLATGVFTSERTQVLNLLLTQAAISIENARSYSKLQKSKSQLTQFLEAIPVGVAVVDKLGHPYYFNQRATQLLAKDIDPALTLDDLTEVYQTYLAGTNQKYPTEKMPIIRALTGEHTTVDDIEIHHNNAIIPIEAWGTPVFDEQGNVIYAIAAFQDITERKQSEHLLANYNRTLEQQVAERTAALQQSEAELRAHEQELRLITDALPVGIGYIDAEQRHRFVNRTYEIWRNCSRDEILGKSIRELVDHTSYQMIEPYINQALRGETTTFEAEIPLPTGKKYLNVTLIPDFDANAQVIGFYALNTDISDRKRAEAASILEERNRMAREIHDTLAQAFTGILVHMGAVSRLVATNPDAMQTHIDTVRDLARSGLTEARRSVAALRPQLLEDGNLWTALKRFIATMSSSTETRLIYDIIGTPYGLPPETENHLLRIGQEAFTNAIKYAHANEIRVELVYEPTSCFLRVKDNGRGFEGTTTTLSQGFGLLGMTERAEHIGAQLSIESQLGQGTEVLVTVNREAAL